MRSTTFDMIGMTLMAIVTILTSGGMLTWAYLKESRGGHEQHGSPASSPPEADLEPEPVTATGRAQR